MTTGTKDIITVIPDLYHGFLFRRDDNMKAMPIYDLNGNLAGIQSAVSAHIPSNMRGYNSFNETIDLPPLEIMPPVLKGIRDSNGILYYTVTAYFKHPRLICSPVTPKGVLPGRGLYIQMGYDPEDDFYHIPRDATQLLYRFKIITNGWYRFKFVTNGWYRFKFVTNSWYRFKIVTNGWYRFKFVTNSWYRFKFVTNGWYRFKFVTNSWYRFKFVTNGWYRFKIVTNGWYRFKIVTNGWYRFKFVTNSWYRFKIVTNGWYRFKFVTNSWYRFKIVTNGWYRFKIVTNGWYRFKIVTNGWYRFKFVTNGTLYFMNMSNQLPCEKIYPLFLLYDMEGNLGAFGWVFQGRPNNFFSDDGMGWFHLTPPTYPFLYDPAMLPACMFNENFQVFGIHVYLQEPNKLLCEPIAHVKQKPTTQRLTPPTRQPPKQTYITSITHDRKRQNSENYAIEALDTLPMS
ncbi:hypothetical protein MAR_008427, partial [Mya arenaria]